MTTTLRRLDLHFRPAGTYRSGNPEASPNRRLTGRLGCLLAVLALVLAPLLVDPLSPRRGGQRFRVRRSPRPRSTPKGAFPRGLRRDQPEPPPTTGSPDTPPTGGPACSGTPTISVAAWTWCAPPAPSPTPTGAIDS